MWVMKNCEPLVPGPALAIEKMPRFVVLEVGVEFVSEFVTRSTRAGAGGITTLDHEIIDYPVEDGVIVKALAGEKDEVVHRDRGLGREEFDLHIANIGFHHGVIGFFEINNQVGLGTPLFCAHGISFQILVNFPGL